MTHASPDAQTIKLADLIDNTMSIAFQDPDFAKTYLAEKKLLLGQLTRGSEQLHTLASSLLRDAEQHLMDLKTAERVGWG